MRMNAKAIGAGALVLFAALSAGRDLWAKELFDNEAVDPVFLTWYCCVVTAVLFYLTVSIRTKPRQPYRFEDLRRGTARVKRHFLGLNIGTLIALATTFLAIEKLDAYKNALIDYGASPIVITAFAVFIRREKLGPSALGGMLVSAAGISILAMALVEETATSLADDLLGAAYAIISCVAMALVLVWTKNLVDLDIKKERVLVNRFYLPILLLPLIWGFNPEPFPSVSFGWLTIWSVAGVSIPLLLIVYAFEHLPVRNVAYAFFLIPVFTFMGSLIQGKFEGVEALIYGLAGFVVLAGVVWSERASMPTGTPAASQPTSADSDNTV